MFSIYQTLAFWKINPRLWLTSYLEAYAANQGKAPKDIHYFLPRNTPEEKHKALSLEAESKAS